MVIVAIIGLFSMVALTSLSGSRQKGNDAAIKQQMHEIQNAAELYALYNGNAYGVAADCQSGMFVSGKLTPLITGLNSANLNSGLICRSTNVGYAVQAPLISDSDKYWCVDATGYQGASTIATLSPTGTPRCPGH